MSLRALTTSVLRKQRIGVFICSPTRFTSKLPYDESKKYEFKTPVFQKVSNLFSKCSEILTLIKCGLRDTIQDMSALAKVTTKIKTNEDGFKLNLRELELFYEMNYDLRRIFPVLILFIIPFGNFLALPLAIKFPRRFLVPQFWTEKQKLKFSQSDHEQRVRTYLPVMSELDDMKACEKCPKWREVLDAVNVGRIPTADDLYECKTLFTGDEAPFAHDNLSNSLVNKLLLMHNLRAYVKRPRLFAHGNYLLFADHYVRTNGGPEVLMPEKLQKLCLQRGVNAHNMTEEEMRTWLSGWLKFSDKIDVDNLGLILIAPALLTLNHSSNSSLLFNK